MIRAVTALMLYGLLISLSPASPQVAAADQEAQTPLFRSKTDAVMVDATVRDEKRRSITGLTADDFEVIDNGMPQRVHDVSYGKLPIDITIALDVSHSVSGGLLDRLRQAVVQLMGDLGKDDRLKLVLFNMKVTRTFDYTRDVRTVERAIRGASAGGGTSFYDAMSVALVSESPSDRRQLAVFFTDGSDSTSTTSGDVLVEVARRTRATLAFVVPAAVTRLSTITSGSGPATFSVPVQKVQVATSPLLRTLTHETGGTVLPVAASSNLSTAFRTVLNEFRSAYVLYYSPRGVDRAGYHSIEVKVKRDGAQVQARRGYFSS
jgi:Ca-activated chloride channel family protein